ncbi:MAG: YggT family protein [bacterium]|nr:YggT family protein [bacterium]
MIAGNFFLALADLLHFIIYFYIIILFIRSVISWMGPVRPNPLIIVLRRLTDPVFRFVHKNLPFTVVGGIDISPIMIIFVLYFIDRLLTGFLFDLAGVGVIGR